MSKVTKKIEKIIVGKVNCFFFNYGEVERKCYRCGYVIEKTSDDKKNLQETINSTGEIPKCGIN